MKTYAQFFVNSFYQIELLRKSVREQQYVFIRKVFTTNPIGYFDDAAHILFDIGEGETAPLKSDPLPA